LHLIHPLGFAPDDKQVKRAGLDYHEWARVHHHQDYPAFLQQLKPQRLFACSTKGKHNYADVVFQPDDVFLFGPESRGIPSEILKTLPEENVIRIPMLPLSRSLNLSNAVAVIVYEAWRQIGFKK
jgi:tRNA (cytidine/uridine-2'-O-)-methyltransferase